MLLKPADDMESSGVYFSVMVKVINVFYRSIDEITVSYLIFWNVIHVMQSWIFHFTLIWWFLIIINVENRFAPNIFVETMLHFFRILW